MPLIPYFVLLLTSLQIAKTWKIYIAKKVIDKSCRETLENYVGIVAFPNIIFHANLFLLQFYNISSTIYNLSSAIFCVLFSGNHVLK